MNDENDEARSGLGVMVQSPANDMGMSQNVVDYNSPSTSNVPPNLMSRASSTNDYGSCEHVIRINPQSTSAPAPGRQAAAGIYSSTGFDMLAALMRVQVNRLTDGGQTISRDDVSSVLASYENGSDPELTKRMWDKDRMPEDLIGTSIQALMRSESKVEFGRPSKRQEQEGLRQKPTFLVAQTRFAKSSARNVAPAIGANGTTIPGGKAMILSPTTKKDVQSPDGTSSNHHSPRTQKWCTSWQYELRQMEKNNRLLAEELASLVSAKKKRKRRKGAGNSQRDCVNCHTKSTPEWRRGPSGNRDLCNSCGLRWAKMQGRISSRGSKRSGSKDGDASSRNSNSPIHSSPLQNELAQKTQSMTPNLNINPGNANTQAPGPMNIKRSDYTGSIGHGSIGVGGISNGGVMGGGTAVPASLGGRTTMESQPVHARSLGFNEGGISGITNIEEGGEGSGTSSMRVGSGR
ncbi:hypothetical protein DID88_001792 [Monilinia fructigena]|uniref:GATA-type domain-containing protein n=1 Tax=Monilinia fructigena TaxID=38457 RepID=A0A395IX87_9HELO|nr:hypothetical protein DID88_001792 [Monilinia fructigena]